MPLPELYYAIDVETDGQVPGLSSMRQLGVCAFSIDSPDLGRFCYNLEPAGGASGEMQTLKWWSETQDKRERFARLSVDARPPGWVMHELRSWVEEQCTGRYQPIPVCAPAAFDFSFVRYYLLRYTGGEDPFAHRAFDLRSYVMALFGQPYMQAGFADLPEHVRSPILHTHDALDDARQLADTVHRLFRAAAKMRLNTG